MQEDGEIFSRKTICLHNAILTAPYHPAGIPFHPHYTMPKTMVARQDCARFVTFPDLPGCVTEGDNLEEALKMASEAMALHLYGMEQDGDEIPTPSNPAEVQIPDDTSSGAFVTLIQARTEPIHHEMQNRAVKKTLTIPKWLNDAAEKEGSTSRRFFNTP